MPMLPAGTPTCARSSSNDGGAFTGGQRWQRRGPDPPDKAAVFHRARPSASILHDAPGGLVANLVAVRTLLMQPAERDIQAK